MNAVAPEGAREGSAVGSSAILRLRNAIEVCQQQSVPPAEWSELRGALREVADALSRLSRRQTDSLLVSEARSLIAEVIQVGAHDLVVESCDLDTARAALTQGGPGLVATMLLVPAWELPEAPTFAEVPDWLWREYSRWIFTAPTYSLSPDAAARFARHLLPHLEELNRWVVRNIGSAAVRSAVEAYLAVISGPSWYGALASSRRHAELRGQILTRFLGRGSEPYSGFPYSRDGRLLRMGFIGHDFGPGADTYSALSQIEMLDPRGFEVHLFALCKSESIEAQQCGRRAKSSQVLPEGTEAQLKALRDADLDIAFFCGDLSDGFNGLVQLALHRVATLQVVNHRSGLTTGLPEIDLYISGNQNPEPDLAKNFSERLGLVRGIERSFSFPRVTGPGTPSRESLGLLTEATLFTTVVTPAGVSVETLEAWAAILSSDSKVRLLVIVPTGAGDRVRNLARFAAGLEAVFSQRGVPTDRVSIFPLNATLPEDVRGILQLSDLYLDSLSASAPVWVAEALALSLPTLVASQSVGGDRDGSTELVCSVGLADLVAADASSYVQLGVALATDGARRESLKSELAEAIALSPLFLDSLAAGDSLGALLEVAFDELMALERAVFRSEQEPLRCFSADDLVTGLETGFSAHASGDMATAAFEANLALRSEPGNAQARHLRGLVLLAEGDAARAVEYLMAALPRLSGRADYWFTLAGALRQNNQAPQAIEALEACLRMDAHNIEALFMLIELAEGVGAADIAREALECLRQIAPDDPRVLAMS